MRTIPHIAGVTIGYAVIFAAVALGVGRFIFERPLLYDGLRFASAAYLVWLAWRIATAEGEAGGVEIGQPQTFLQAALFQWINPKGVAIALTVSATYISPASLMQDLATLSAMIFFVTLASAATWALFGEAVRGVLADRRRRQVFNYAMALALVATLWPLFAPLR